MPTNRTQSVSSSNPQEQLHEAASAARENVRQMGGAAKEIAREQVDHVVDKAVSLRDAMASKVRQNPLPSLLIAAGAGLLAGAILRRR